MNGRIQKSVRLPFGYVVHIEFVDEPKMRDEADCDHEDLTPDGLWDDETRTIWIMQNLPTKRLRYVLAHELHHAIVDYLHHLFNEGAACP